MPDVALAPVQSPLAVQEVASVELQVKVVNCPAYTVVGEAEKVIVGAGVEVTVTVTDLLVFPRGPVHESAYVVVVVGKKSCANTPIPTFSPVQPPLAIQEVTLA